MGIRMGWNLAYADGQILWERAYIPQILQTLPHKEAKI
jgi:hypothetical protein